MARLPRHGAKMNKVKIGTTIEVDTKAALDGLMQAAPDSLRTPGEAIDYIANIAMGLQPRVAKTVDTACMEQIRIIEKEMKLLPQDGSREMMWSDLEASRSQLKRLHEHFSSYYEQDGAPHELRRIELSDDAYALIPSDWIVLGTVDDAAECNKVGVVELARNLGAAPRILCSFITVVTTRIRSLPRLHVHGFLAVNRLTILSQWITSARPMIQKA